MKKQSGTYLFFTGYFPKGKWAEIVVSKIFQKAIITLHHVNLLWKEIGCG